MRGTTVAPVMRLVLILGLVYAASFLPPDTSLSQVGRTGVLRACIPREYPTLVTNDPARPGLDVELVRAVAEELGVSAYLAVNPAMGTSFDPRQWNVTRSQCHLLAGGVVDSVTTRSYLEVTPAYLLTGWTIISPRGGGLQEDMTLGVYFSNVNLDRLEVSRVLTEYRLSAVPFGTVGAAASALRAGKVDGLLMESLSATQLADRNGWQLLPPPEGLSVYPLVLGLWKGDLTLKRGVVAAIQDLEASGRLEELRQRYGVEGFGIE